MQRKKLASLYIEPQIPPTQSVPATIHSFSQHTNDEFTATLAIPPNAVSRSFSSNDKYVLTLSLVLKILPSTVKEAISALFIYPKRGSPLNPEIVFPLPSKLPSKLY